MKYEDFKELFEQKFYSMKDNRIVEWKVRKVLLCNYNRDSGSNNLYPIHDGNLDVEYEVGKIRRNGEYECATVNEFTIGKTFFTSITDLVNHIMPE